MIGKYLLIMAICGFVIGLVVSLELVSLGVVCRDSHGAVYFFEPSGCH